MTNLVFSATERKQIALRFKTLYEIVTADTWVTGNMGEITREEAGGYNKIIDENEVRKLGKNGKRAEKGDLEEGLKMCLVGAAAYVNGPTEEEILALLATQIVLDGKVEPELMDAVKRKLIREGGSATHSAAALALFDHFINGGSTKAFDDEEYESSTMSAASAASGVCIEFNDNQTDDGAGIVRSMIKRATKLYDKLELVWRVELKHGNHIAKMVAARDKDYANLDKLF